MSAKAPSAKRASTRKLRAPQESARPAPVGTPPVRDPSESRRRPQERSTAQSAQVGHSERFFCQIPTSQSQNIGKPQDMLWSLNRTRLEPARLSRLFVYRTASPPALFRCATLALALSRPGGCNRRHDM